MVQGRTRPGHLLPGWLWTTATLAGALILCAPVSGQAAVEAAVVEGMQMPVWLIRDGRRSALRPQASLVPGDKIITGQRARLRLRMAEGSLVKLGENADFKIADFEPSTTRGGAFRGILDVIKGAFRYTTTMLSRRHRRYLRIRVAGVTAGIRGTDLWGKAGPDRDIVCLIEGRIDVQRGKEAPFEMSQALSFYIAPKGEPALPVAPVALAQLRQWAAETELHRGDGVVRGGGQWIVNIASFRNGSAADVEAKKIADAGYATDVVLVELDGQPWYRVQIIGVDGYGDALGLADDLRAAGLSRQPWVVKSP